MNDVVPEGQRLIAEFLCAQERVRQAENQLNLANCDLSNAHSALAKWLMPADMRPGEKVAVWMDDSLFQVELERAPAFEAETGDAVEHYEPKVTVRTRGKHFERLRGNR